MIGLHWESCICPEWHLENDRYTAMGSADWQRTRLSSSLKLKTLLFPDLGSYLTPGNNLLGTAWPAAMLSSTIMEAGRQRERERKRERERESERSRERERIILSNSVAESAIKVISKSVLSAIWPKALSLLLSFRTKFALAIYCSFKGKPQHNRVHSWLYRLAVKSPLNIILSEPMWVHGLQHSVTVTVASH